MGVLSFTVKQMAEQKAEVVHFHVSPRLLSLSGVCNPWQAELKRKVSTDTGSGSRLTFHDIMKPMQSSANIC